MKKYLFDKNDFDDEKSGEKVFYTEEQIVMAKTQSYAQGKVDGFNEAQQSQNEQLLKITESLTQKCAGLTASEDRRETDKFDSAAKIAMQIVQKLMPKLSEQFSLHEIEGVITTALETRQDEPRIAITLPTQHLDAL